MFGSVFVLNTKKLYHEKNIILSDDHFLSD